MKRFAIRQCCILSICVLSAVMLSACSFLIGSSVVDYDSFDPDKQGILDVKTKPAYDDTDGANQREKCYTIASFRRIQACDDFTPDAVTVYDYYADQDSEQSKMDPAVIADICGAMAALDDHATMNYKIFLDGETYFLYRELNVNLWIPCELYYYDTVQKKLYLLYTFDDEKVTAIRIRDLDRLNQWSLY